MLQAATSALGRQGPTQKLDVVGNIKSTGYGIFPSGIAPAATGAPDAKIFSPSGDYLATTNWGINYNEGTPDYIEFNNGSGATSRIALDDGSAHFGLNGGSVGVGISTPASTSLLDLTSTTKGFLAPRMTTIQRDAIATPATGLMIYNTTTNAYNVFNGTSWGTTGGIAGSGTLNYVAKWTPDGSTLGNSIIFDNGTNVGIGTTGPEAGNLLDIYTTGADPSTQMQVRANRTAYGNIRGTLKTYAGGSSSADYFKMSVDTGSIILDSGGSVDQFILTHAGNVGIGTTGPNQKLEVSGNVRLTSMDNQLEIGGANHVVSYGWSSYSGGSYPVTQFGTGTGRGDGGSRLFIGLDRYNGNTSGAFNGNEIISRANTPWMVPTYANTGYVGIWATDSSDRIQIGRWGDPYNLETGGALTINSSGNVGIGTTGPRGKLEIPSNTAGSVIIGTPNEITIGTVDIGSAAGGTPLSLTDATYAHIYFDFGTFGAKMRSDSDLVLGTAGPTVAMTLKGTSGNVGIGTTGPGYKLDVSAGATTVGINTNGYVQDGSGIMDGNYVPSHSWTISSGSVGIFNQNGTTAENERIWSDNPHGVRSIIWRVPSNDVESNDDGGWNSNSFPIDHTKTYRVSTWIKRSVVMNGTTYFGISGSNVTLLSGVAETNPYFFCSTLPALDKWYLLVGYIHGSGDTSTTHYGGMYDGETGQKVVSFNGGGNCSTDFKFTTSATTQVHRTYLYYSTDTTAQQYWWDPKFEEVNGKESSILALLGIPRSNSTGMYWGSGAKIGIGYTDPGTATLAVNGNVGIGSTSPGATLDINGSLRASSMDLLQVTTVSPWNFAAKPAGWYRFASNTGNRANATFELRENADHSTLVLRVGSSYNTTAGSSVTVLNHSIYSSATFQQIRLLTNTTYDPQYLEVYVNPHNNDNQAFYAYMKDNLLNSGWTLENFTTGAIPGGYTATVYDVDNNFMVAQNGDAESLRMTRAGSIGIGTTSPGAKLDINTATTNTRTILSESGVAKTFMETNSGKLQFGSISGNVGIYANNLEKVTVQTDGNVGISSTSPGAKLDVALTNNQLVKLNGAASGIWGQNIGLLSQSSQAQITTNGALPISFYTGGTINSMTSGTERMRIASGGNVGIGGALNTNAQLDLNGGTILAGQYCPTSTCQRYIVPNGTSRIDQLQVASDLPNNTGYISFLDANNSYVKIASISAQATGTVVIDNSATNITDVGYPTVPDLCIGDPYWCTGKIDAGTIDPPYTINGKKYATFLTAMTGVKEETTGTIATNYQFEIRNLKSNSNELISKGYAVKVIDFNDLPEASDLWLFSKTTNLRKQLGKMTVLLTPSDDTRTWYKVDNATHSLTIYSSRPTTVSYRLTAPRFDGERWRNEKPGGSGGFELNDPDQPSLVALNQAGNVPPETFTISPSLVSLRGTSEASDAAILTNEIASLLSVARNDIKVISDKTGDFIEEVGVFAQITVGQIKAGFIETENAIVNNILLAKNHHRAGKNNFSGGGDKRNKNAGRGFSCVIARNE